MLLEDKNAVIYGAGGKIGGAVARAFACGGQGLPHRSNPGEPRGGGRADPLRGKRGRDGADRCPRRDGGRRTRRHS